MKVTLKKDLCLGCGVCAALCPSFFEMGRDGRSRLKGGKLDPQTEEETLTVEQIGCTKDAADSCPTQAIVVE